MAQTLNAHPPQYHNQENKFTRDHESNLNPLPYSNPPPRNPPSVAVQYWECLKNHAAAIGGHVMDGCGEFMPDGEGETPESFKCAACKCHRSFHRRVENPIQYQHQHQHQSRPCPTRSVMLAFGGCNTNTVRVESNSSGDHLSSMFLPDSERRLMMGSMEDKLNYYYPEEEGSGKKKRFRSKFTAEQKEKMMEFAEKLGWKMAKQQEEEVKRFCAEVGVKKKVFTVWMHNSKQAMKRKEKM